MVTKVVKKMAKKKPLVVIKKKVKKRRKKLISTYSNRFAKISKKKSPGKPNSSKKGVGTIKIGQTENPGPQKTEIEPEDSES